jgi:ABC-2 type transport system ATP-binding protein
MSTSILQAENLTKRYSDFTAVKNLSLEVFEGEVFGFLGPNGAGKTTSIHMICGLLKPDSGQVKLRGVPMWNGSRQWKSSHSLIGMCPQNIVLWERLTCLEQLELMGQMYGLPGKLARTRAENLMEELDLAEKRNQQARKLSGGMQRRLNLAMALVHDPPIVILDEPEAGLDPQSRVKVREYIQALARRPAENGAPHTVILTTHNMDEAERLADRIAIIDHGELLVLDTPEKLKQCVGEGDVIEIQLSEPMPSIQTLQAALHGKATHVHLDTAHHTLQVRALNAIGMLPEILAELARYGVPPGEVSIRANTLEDVFIQLTGRRLRE